jgi:RND family efflux transporter MFP subunit
MSNITKLFVVIIIIVVALGVSYLLATSGKSPERSERAYPGPLVDAVTVGLSNHEAQVIGHGTVRARIAVQLVPQVAGRVVETHPGLAAGGYFEAGEPLVVIEPADYELAVQRAQAAVARAEVNLQMQEAEAEVAQREWQRLHPGEPPPSPLVVRQPQVDQARAELESSRADLATARLNLERTRISLPFRGRVLSENVDIGQFVVAGQAVASVYGTDAMEIQVPLEDSELAWFDIPDGNGQSRRADVRVEADYAGADHTWFGRVVRTEGQVEPTTRMVPVVVEVTEPLSDQEQPVPLVPGMFVKVMIAGRTLEAVAVVPRHAVHEGDKVWVVEQGKLRIRQVVVTHYEDDKAFIGKGLSDGSQVVVSQLDVVTDGMQVRIAEDSGVQS